MCAHVLICVCWKWHFQIQLNKFWKAFYIIDIFNFSCVVHYLYVILVCSLILQINCLWWLWSWLTSWHIRRKFCSMTLDNKVALTCVCLCCGANGKWWHYKSYRLEQHCMELVCNIKGEKVVQKKSKAKTLFIHSKPTFYVVFL